MVVPFTRDAQDFLKNAEFRPLPPPHTVSHSFLALFMATRVLFFCFQSLPKLVWMMYNLKMMNTIWVVFVKLEQSTTLPIYINIFIAFFPKRGNLGFGGE
jgi:hypothetical protein